MAETPKSGLEGTGAQRLVMDVGVPDAMDWFLREVLPLEAVLVRYLRQNWRDQSDIEDLLQDVYIRVYEAAKRQLPEKAKPFVFTTARNLLINRMRDHAVVPIEAVADLDALGVAIDTPGPDRTALARDELRRLSEAIDRLPPHCRDVIVLRRIENLSRSEIARRLNIAETTVSSYLTEAIYALSNLLNADPTDPRVRP
ncbi:MAG TPA: RNA polymerase sigma factor [Rhizomicrobium sp.]|nr:RNA polymerase sigma factor [Rhizomicrobium sp.]